MHHIPFIASCRGAVLVKFLVLCTVTFVLASGSAIAYAKKGAPGGGWGAPDTGGYSGPGPALVTVQQALSMPAGTWVSIQGKVTKYLGGKQYIIADSTGPADAKIGPKAWMGQNVSEADTVVFQGTVIKEWLQTRIDVKRVIKQ